MQIVTQIREWKLQERHFHKWEVVLSHESERDDQNTDDVIDWWQPVSHDLEAREQRTSPNCPVSQYALVRRRFADHDQGVAVSVCAWWVRHVLLYEYLSVRRKHYAVSIMFVERVVVLYFVLGLYYDGFFCECRPLVTVKWKKAWNCSK